MIGDSVDRISIGYPGVVRWGRPAEEPVNLGKGWVGFDFAQAFDCAVRVMNDADMQALGGYEGGRMLYLGLGTGVGTTLIADGAISQIALGQLPFKDGKAFDDLLTKEAIEKIGLEAWRKAVGEAAAMLKNAMLADYVLLGGSGAEKFDKFCRRVAAAEVIKTLTLAASGCGRISASIRRRSGIRRKISPARSVMTRGTRGRSLRAPRPQQPQGRAMSLISCVASRRPFL